MTIAIYLAHLNPLTNAHTEIIKDLAKNDDVVVMPVRFLIDGNEVNSKSFPFTFELRKEMLESVFGDSITVSSNYTFHAPFKKYFPPLVSRGSWELRKEILSQIDGDYYTYTGDKAEGLMLKIYRLKPKVGQRKKLSATSVKNDMYDSVLTNKNNWENQVPKILVGATFQNFLGEPPFKNPFGQQPFKTLWENYFSKPLRRANI